MRNDSLLKFGLILMLVCIVAALALAATYRLTRGRIEAQARLRERRALEIVLPAAVRFSELKKGELVDYYEGTDDEGRVVGYVFPGAARGYSSTIKVITGVDSGGVITGIEIIEQNETPGLGDKAVRAPSRRTFWQALAGEGGEEGDVRPPFQDQFAGKGRGDLKVVVGPTGDNIQAITGATITSRAVTKAVRDSVEAFLKQHTSRQAVNGVVLE